MEKLGGGKKRESGEKRERERDGKREEREKIEKRERDKNGIKKLNMRIRILISYNFYHLIIDLY